MILMIDNYDSFTYNLYQYIGEIDSNIEVYRNDAIEVDQVLQKKPSHIIISPGPGYPSAAGICVELIKHSNNIPLLGVCLGHQAIGEAFGANITHAPRIMHGKSDEISIDQTCALFEELSLQEVVGRYHSLVIEPNTLPDTLKVTATSDDGCIMGIQHVSQPIYGIQFHPESILTPNGKKMIENFLRIE